MDLNHLHLHVRDVAKAAGFYERWFGFREHVRHGDILFLRNEQGFDLALAPGEPASLPSWFHFGFRLGSRETVLDLHRRMTAERVRLGELFDEPDLASFRCSDPDDHAIEVYWE
jgi:catechol 2,3-dioxygenase-like lactoylglutathione lyase family enzyme